jgi:hypothetical protein
MKELPICKFYTTTGYSKFEPVCLKRLKANKKCHEKRDDCPEYKPSLTKDRRVT